MEGRESFALLMEMRTGKTKVALDDFGRLELIGQAQDLLVIAPGGVYTTWAGACAEHFSPDLAKRALVHTWVSGPNATQRRALAAFMAVADRPRALLMNVEALSSVKEARETAIAFAKSRRSVVIIDESTIIKNPASKRTKFINKEIGDVANYRRILSGLPTPKNPLDIYSQMEFLNWKILGHRSFFSFRGRYAVLQPIVVGGRTIQLVKGYRDVEDLQAKIEPHSYRKLMTECYDMPPKTYSIREVKLTPEQVRLYADMKKYSTSQLNETSHVSATVVIAQMIRLHQILCGHTTDEEGNHHEFPENRTAELLSLLEEYTGKAIIWCSYDADIQKVVRELRAVYGETSVARFWGGNVKTRDAEEAQFKTDPECRFMVATPAAGGRGRTWSGANLIIYYSNQNDLEQRSQSEERGTGMDKVDPVAVVDLMVPNTVDWVFVNALRKKIDLAATVTGDAWREWIV